MAEVSAGRKSAGLTHWRWRGGSGRRSGRGARGNSRRGSRGGSGERSDSGSELEEISGDGEAASASGAANSAGTSGCGSRKPPVASASASVSKCGSVASTGSTGAGKFSCVAGLAAASGARFAGRRPRPPRRLRRRLIGRRAAAGEFKFDCSSGTIFREDGGLAGKCNRELRRRADKLRVAGGQRSYFNQPTIFSPDQIAFTGWRSRATANFLPFTKISAASGRVL